MNYEIVGLCETGLKRTINQDAVFWSKSQDAVISVVADGIGGHNHGEVASNLIKQTVSKCWNMFLQNSQYQDFRAMITLLKSELEKANQKLFQECSSAGICGSTFVLLFIFHNQYGILYAGDSRVYLKKGFSVSQITIDEVWENQQNLSQEMRKNLLHSNRGKLVNAFGSEADLHMRMLMNELKGGELFLLCSDGLYKMCPDKQIHGAMNKARRSVEGMRVALLELKEQIEKAGAKDNFSIILIKASR